jgi:type IV pilus assembly protein PilY1
MLHGFSAGNYSGGSFNASSSVNTGNELLAYMPSTVLTQIAGNSATVYPTDYNFPDPSYTHHYFVDASAGRGDLYYGSAWHTWLVGGLGGGGQAIYALDITNPNQFTQGHAATQVIKELNTSNLTCSNNSTCYKDLGLTYGTPIIQRMHDGNWAVIFGNGYNSTNETAVIFVATIDKTSGSWTVYELTTNSQTPNGISYVTPADLDGDNVVDYLYAGDLFGNLWRFDVTSSSEAAWAVSTYGGSTSNPLPLFTALNQNGFVQPITTAPLVLKLTQTSTYRLVIGFGTGKNLETSDLLPDNTPGGVQSFYGIWDYNLSAWNANQNVSQKYMAQSTTVSINRSLLQQQTATTYDANGCAETASTCANHSAPGAAAYRSLSANAVCWQGSSTCNSTTANSSAVNNQYGYFLDFPSTGEALIYNPIQINGIPVFNTTIPAASTQGLTCYAPAPPGGWTMALNPYDGAALAGAFFINTVSVNASGAFANAVGSPSWVQFNSNNYLIDKSATNTVVVQAINTTTPTPPTSATIPTGHRVGWTQLR